MKRIILFFLLSQCLYSLYGQQKDSLNICVFIMYKPAVMAFDIPIQKCILHNDMGQIKQEINDSFEIDGSILSINSLIAGEHKLFEVTFISKTCDTVAVLFFINKNKKIIKSKSYKINDDKLDIRYESFKDGIIVYRKIRTPLEIKTVAFEIRIKKGVIDDYVDDGVSIWGIE